MDKLTQFYISLSKDTKKMARFNQGSNDSEIADNREKMLEAAGIDNGAEIIRLSQKQLQAVMAEQLATQTEQWSNVNQLSPNTDNTSNTDNTISQFGRSIR